MNQKNSKIFLIGGLCLLMAIVSGCAPNITKETETTVISEGKDVILDSNQMNDMTEYTQPADPDYDPDADLPRNLESMVLPMDAFNIMFMENDYSYDVKNPLVFWSGILYAVGNHGYIHPEVAQIEGSYHLPASAVQEFAEALFAEAGGIEEVPLPEELAEKISYDETENVYTFQMGDRGLSEYEMLEYMENKDGTFDITIRLYSLEDESTICTGRYHVIPNENTIEQEEAIFHFRIMNANIERPMTRE